jgi:hypothetical protein
LAAVATAVWIILVLRSTAQVRLHPEVPLLALLRLVHLWIALLFLILGRSGRVQEGCLDDRAG